MPRPKVGDLWCEKRWPEDDIIHVYDGKQWITPPDDGEKLMASPPTNEEIIETWQRCRATLLRIMESQPFAIAAVKRDIPEGTNKMHLPLVKYEMHEDNGHKKIFSGTLLIEVL